MLRADPVFAVLPPHSHLLGPIKSEPAQWTHPAFQTGGWNGALVDMVFHSDLPVAQVAAFYNARAQAAGWRPDPPGGLGFPLGWSKEYKGGISADLSFFYGNGVTASPTPGNNGTYELSGSISPKWG